MKIVFTVNEGSVAQIKKKSVGDLFFSLYHITSDL